MWRHGYTYSGHATVAAAALANLDILEGMLPGALDLEERLATALGPLGRHGLVGEVRTGTGVLGAIQLRADLVMADPGLPPRVISACRDQGILTRMLVGNAIQISPPLMLDDTGVVELVDGLKAALDQCLAE